MALKRTRLTMFSVGAAALVLLMADAALQGQPAPASRGAGEPAKTPPAGAPPAKGAAIPEPPANRALAREQLELVERATADLNRLAQGGELSLADPKFSLWGRRRVEALRNSRAEKAEIVAALEKYLAFMKSQEKRIEELYRKDMATRVDVMDVKFRRLEAEIWRNQEEAR